MPLRGPFASISTIDLLFHDPHAAATVPLAQIRVLCTHITVALIEADLIADDSDLPAAHIGDDKGGGPVWLAGPTGAARRQVMVAAGMLSVHVGVSAADAVKLLKARAYATNSTTDDVAAALVAGHLPTTAFELD